MDPSAYEIVEPIQKLRPFIRRFLVTDHPEAINETVHPAPTGYNYIGWIFDGSVAVHVNGKLLAPPQKDKLHFAGQIQHQEIEVVYSGRLGHILAECTATGFYSLTGISGETAHASGLSIESLAPELAVHIDQKLATVKDLLDADNRTSHRVDIFQSQLSTLVSGALTVPGYISNTVEWIEKVDGNIQVSDIAEHLQISPRQLRRKFKEIVGITPKYFAKVLQINKSLLALYSGDYETLGALAQETGFYDQAHFINAMQQFFAASPQEFIQSSEPLLSVFLGQSRRCL